MADSRRIGAVFALLVLILDQLSKLWVLVVFHPYEVLPVMPVFNLTLVFNEGAAFSFLAHAGGWQRGFLVLLSSVISGVLLIWLRRLQPSEKWTALALSLVLGGALGNLLDRIRLGKVVDFLDVHWHQWHWPAFNLADSSITLGVILLAFAAFKEGRTQ